MSKANTWNNNEIASLALVSLSLFALEARKEAPLWYQWDESEKGAMMFPGHSRPQTISIKLWMLICLQICIIYELPSGSASSLQDVLLYFVGFRIGAFVCAA